MLEPPSNPDFRSDDQIRVQKNCDRTVQIALSPSILSEDGYRSSATLDELDSSPDPAGRIVENPEEFKWNNVTNTSTVAANNTLPDFDDVVDIDTTDDIIA